MVMSLYSILQREINALSMQVVRRVEVKGPLWISIVHYESIKV